MAQHIGALALLVAQRPTPALQVEFTRKALTGGPDGGPLSYRSAKDLAQRQYMTDLTHAPFALDNAQFSAHPFKRSAATGKRIAVVGAGPAGLSCAHRLAMHGHDVVVFEAWRQNGFAMPV